MNINNTRKGGARLERLIVQFGLSLDAAQAFYDSGGDANIALIPEFMVHHQTDQFGSLVTNSSSFDATRSNQRIILDEVPHEVTFSDNQFRTVYGTYETKSKVRLAEGSLVVSWRGQFNEQSANLNGYTDWVRSTMLISVP